MEFFNALKSCGFFDKNDLNIFFLSSNVSNNPEE